MNVSKSSTDVNDDSLPLPLVIVLVIPAIVIITLTILGNLLVLRFKARVGRTNTTLLVWNLGLTDFLVGVIVLPLAAIHLLHRKWMFGRAICRIWVAADVTFCTCSVVTICTISVDRYLAVTRPLKYKSFVTKCKVILVIIFIWVFSSTILLATVEWDYSTSTTNQSICFAGNEIRYLAHSVVLAFFLPASVTLTLYWRIYKLARNRQRALDRGFLMILGHNMNFLTNTLSQSTALRVHIGRNNGMVEHQRRVLRTHERIAKTLGVVSCSFLFCWLPFFLLYLTNYNCQGCLPTVAIDISSWLGYCNSMLNPIIYSFTVKEFKRSAVRAIMPFWIIIYNICPLKISKPPDRSTRTITRNLASKPRKTCENANCRVNNRHQRMLNSVTCGTSTDKNNISNGAICSNGKSNGIIWNSNTKLRRFNSVTICEEKHQNLTKSRRDMRNSVSTNDFSEFDTNKILTSSFTDLFNTATITSSFCRSQKESKSTFFSSSTSSTQIIDGSFKLPCYINYKQRHSLPAIVGIQSSLFNTRVFNRSKTLTKEASKDFMKNKIKTIEKTRKQHHQPILTQSTKRSWFLTKRNMSAKQKRKYAKPPRLFLRSKTEDHPCGHPAFEPGSRISSIIYRQLFTNNKAQRTLPSKEQCENTDKSAPQVRVLCTTNEADL